MMLDIYSEMAYLGGKPLMLNTDIHESADVVLIVPLPEEFNAIKTVLNFRQIDASKFCTIGSSTPASRNS